jgi:GNAT superfamily N-acetyltransferase
MQIREIDLKELDTAHCVVNQLRTNLSYKDFEDLIYDMRHIEYKMFGVFERGKLVNYAGVNVSTNLYHKRHLFIYDFVTDINNRKKGYGRMMIEYLRDYARTCMCENIVLGSGFQKEIAYSFFEENDFEERSYVFVKKI